MKKTLTGFIVILVSVLSGLWFSGKETRVVTTEIEIEASTDKVWNTLVRIENWKDWSPIIKDSEGTASKGAKLIITMISEEGKSGKPGPRYEPVITNFEPSKNLTWTANMGFNFIMTNGKVLELVPTSIGTKLIHKETFSGVIVPLMWGKVQENVPKMLDSMNLALKQLVERQ